MVKLEGLVKELDSMILEAFSNLNNSMSSLVKIIFIVTFVQILRVAGLTGEIFKSSEER